MGEEVEDVDVVEEADRGEGGVGENDKVSMTARRIRVENATGSWEEMRLNRGTGVEEE